MCRQESLNSSSRDIFDLNSLILPRKLISSSRGMLCQGKSINSSIESVVSGNLVIKESRSTMYCDNLFFAELNFFMVLLAEFRGGVYLAGGLGSCKGLLKKLVSSRVTGDPTRLLPAYAYVRQ